MKNNLNFNSRINKDVSFDKTLKATSLLYLKEALFKEQYEKCAELIQTAKGFGAEKSEISKIIVASVSRIRGSPQIAPDKVGRDKPVRGRRRF